MRTAAPANKQAFCNRRDHGTSKQVSFEMLAAVVPDATLWGGRQTRDCIAPGIWWVSTASHGGAWLAPERLAAMPEALRAVGEGPWFEEDCAWSAVALAFPAEFRAWAAKRNWTGDAVAAALDTLRNWFPDQHDAWAGGVLGPNESYVRREYPNGKPWKRRVV